MEGGTGEQENSESSQPERKLIVSRLRPLILRALGVWPEDLTEQTVTSTYPLPGGDVIECSASRLGGLIITTVSYEDIPDKVMAGVNMSIKTTYDLVGEADIFTNNEYLAVDDDGRPISEDILSKIVGGQAGPLPDISDELNIFEEEEWLSAALQNLQPNP